ncbi:MAG: 6,7-dimethyl-8-ribityllumazine synthase [Actinomycetota bacterium]|jgi:6,7-dimethyl-8-ribityllumazine synthase|nr:6,7-dimethyl-8-ribityllumazine synthase [Actinomycetota bacterium]
MSGSGSPDITVSADGLRVAIVASSWHQVVMDGLIAGATRACQQAGADATIIRVAGSFELPIVVQECAASGEYDATVALGVIIRGGTPHFEYVSSGATDGLMRVSLDTRVPVGFGLLTCDDEQQALDRAGLEGSHEDKGAEATWAALMTAATLRELR